MIIMDEIERRLYTWYRYVVEGDKDVPEEIRLWNWNPMRNIQQALYLVEALDMDVDLCKVIAEDGVNTRWEVKIYDVGTDAFKTAASSILSEAITRCVYDVLEEESLV